VLQVSDGEYLHAWCQHPLMYNRNDSNYIADFRATQQNIYMPASCELSEYQLNIGIYRPLYSDNSWEKKNNSEITCLQQHVSNRHTYIHT